ncbi:MAG: hypothetical protein KDD19_14800, partial [Phaeodactylibacter sp.]|nr:hypothetical protein [Phaeodactylibacter sp.]
MKIKHQNKISRFPEIASNFLKRRRPLVNWGLRLGSVLVVVALLFSVFRYGIRLKEMGYTTYFNHALQKIARFDFSF